MMSFGLIQVTSGLTVCFHIVNLLRDCRHHLLQNRLCSRDPYLFVTGQMSPPFYVNTLIARSINSGLSYQGDNQLHVTAQTKYTLWGRGMKHRYTKQKNNNIENILQNKRGGKRHRQGGTEDKEKRNRGKNKSYGSQSDKLQSGCFRHT